VRFRTFWALAQATCRVDKQLFLAIHAVVCFDKLAGFLQFYTGDELLLSFGLRGYWPNVTFQVFVWLPRVDGVRKHLPFVLVALLYSDVLALGLQIQLISLSYKFIWLRSDGIADVCLDSEIIIEGWGSLPRWQLPVSDA